MSIPTVKVNIPPLIFNENFDNSNNLQEEDIYTSNKDSNNSPKYLPSS